MIKSNMQKVARLSEGREKLGVGGQVRDIKNRRDVL